MPDYQEAKLYTIRCLTTGKQYIGSTTAKTLAKRLAEHKSNYTRHVKGLIKNNSSSGEIIGMGNYRIELIENFPCANRDELSAREGYYIRGRECVNKHITGRTVKEWEEDNKERTKEVKKHYRQDNKEHIKQYYQQNKELLIGQAKQRYETNKVEISKQRQQYRLDNKELIAERKKNYYIDNNIGEQRKQQRIYAAAAKEMRAIGFN